MSNRHTRHQMAIRERSRLQQRLNEEGPFEFRSRNMYRTPNAAAAHKIFSANNTLSKLDLFRNRGNTVKRHGSKRNGSKTNSGGSTLKKLIGGFNKLFR